MRILISTGIYPPEIGGPAQYAKNLFDVWTQKGYNVTVSTYAWERKLPTGIRHLFFLIKIIPKIINSDFVIVLDTWSAALPTMYACKLLNKKYIIRTGGDFLWESYVERTGDLILFKDFYNNSKNKLNKKEKIIFNLTKKVLKNSQKIIFSTAWQRDVFVNAYDINLEKTYIVENYCGERLEISEPENRLFIASTRKLKWKNIILVKNSFGRARERILEKHEEDIELFTENLPYKEFINKLRKSYCVVLNSIGDISPNMILDSIRVGVPFILTKENGINHIIKDAGIVVDPLNEKELEDAIFWISNPENRRKQAEKVKKINYYHPWEAISQEIINVMQE